MRAGKAYISSLGTTSLLIASSLLLLSAVGALLAFDRWPTHAAAGAQTVPVGVSERDVAIERPSRGAARPAERSPGRRLVQSAVSAASAEPAIASAAVAAVPAESGSATAQAPAPAVQPAPAPAAPPEEQPAAPEEAAPEPPPAGPQAPASGATPLVPPVVPGDVTAPGGSGVGQVTGVVGDGADGAGPAPGLPVQGPGGTTGGVGEPLVVRARPGDR